MFTWDIVGTTWTNEARRAAVRGLSLLEVMIAMTVLAFGLLGMLVDAGAGAEQRGVRPADTYTDAMRIGLDQLESSSIRAGPTHVQPTAWTRRSR